MSKWYEEQVLSSLQRIERLLEKTNNKDVPMPTVKVKEDVWKEIYKKKLIDTACRWLYKNCTIDCQEGDSETIEDFRKAMEEES